MKNLSGKWTSSFIQNNKIYNETVFFKQKKDKISADITLSFEGQMCKYNFEGKIKNNIITGTYESIEASEIECGSISLKIINDNFLYGVTTYISNEKNNDDVVQSPYALFRNTENNLGTFNVCAKCVNAKASCCSNHFVDAPMILPFEINEISKFAKEPLSTFAKEINFSQMYGDIGLKSLYQMKKQDNNDACHFYKDGKCTIYDIRPIDCRIFPYDIKLEPDGNYYLVCYITDNCEIKNVDIESLKMVSYNTRLFLRLLLPYLREWSDPYCSKLLTQKEKYRIICKIEDLF